MKIRRTLYGKGTFWGAVKLKGRGWRIGFGSGFLEIMSGMSGLYLFSKDKKGGKPNGRSKRETN